MVTDRCGEVINNRARWRTKRIGECNSLSCVLFNHEMRPAGLGLRGSAKVAHRCSPDLTHPKKQAAVA